MPAAILAWLAAHQALAGTLAIWFGCTAAGIDVVEKAIDLKDKIVAEQPRDETPAAQK